MKVKFYIGSTIIALSALAGFIIHDLSRMTPETIIMCALGEGNIRIPSQICEHYIYNYRDIEADAVILANGSGLGFILEGKDEEKYRLAELYISNGLSVDSVNHAAGYNITSLHGAVIENDVDMVSFLLNHGASRDIKDTGMKMTAIELAQYLQGKETEVDRSQIIEILSN